MPSNVAVSQGDLGRRIAEARDSLGRTQEELANEIGLDRTAVVKVEAGTRKVSATELVAIATALERPIDWFVLESPPAVVSRRRDPAVGGFSRSLDRALEHVARDVDFLVSRELLVPSGHLLTADVPASFDDAENLAGRTRDAAQAGDGPLLDLQAVCERLGLLGFSLALGPDAGDAAYVEVGDLGVGLVNGTSEPGRRRFSLAHELGHHLVGDAYEPTPRLDAVGDTERFLNAFAAYLLMPRAGVVGIWNEFSQLSSRLAAVALAVRFRVSWTAACNQLRNLELVDSRERQRLVDVDLTKGEVLEFGERWISELDPPAIPPGYAQAVLHAYRANRLTSSRTVELLHGSVEESDLPSQEGVSLDQLRGDF